VRGLAHLHAHAVIHRDVKPANLLLDRAHIARIGDFGVARALGHGASGTTVTHMQTTNAAGTTLYMAPEYMKGTCSPVVDSFALGVVALELLTGRHASAPTEGFEHLLDLFEEELDEPHGLLARLDPSLPRAEWEPLAPLVGRLHAVIHRCLEHKRKKRATIDELVPIFEGARKEASAGMAAPAADNECVICLEAPKSHVLTPCGQ